MVKNLPAMWKTRVQSLGWEDPLEEGMATHSSILAWRIPWIEESGGLQPMGSQRVRHDSTTDTDVYMPIYRLFQFVPPQQENSRKTSTTASLTMLNPLTVWITTNCGKSLGILVNLTCLLRSLYGDKNLQLELDVEQRTKLDREYIVTRLYIVTLLI